MKGHIHLDSQYVMYAKQSYDWASRLIMMVSQYLKQYELLACIIMSTIPTFSFLENFLFTNYLSPQKFGMYGTVTVCPFF